MYSSRCNPTRDPQKVVFKERTCHVLASALNVRLESNSSALPPIATELMRHGETPLSAISGLMHRSEMRPLR